MAKKVVKKLKYWQTDAGKASAKRYRESKKGKTAYARYQKRQKQLRKESA